MSHILSSALILTWACTIASHAQQVRFAAFGDYGQSSSSQAVATRVIASNPDFVVTLGDNTYSTTNNTANWDNAVGQYYRQFIRYPAGSPSAWASQGSAVNRFFPSIGNHDMDVGNSPAAFTNYFDLPGNERYYSVNQGLVEIFVLSSDSREPSGVTVGSTQYNWFTQQIAASTARWKVVVFHHPFQTSTTTSHGPSTYMNWGFENMGVDMVMQGHNHTMERLSYGGIPWIVSGAGGRSHYFFLLVSPNSRFRNRTDYGFSLVTITPSTMTHQFINTNGTVLDTFTVTKPCPADVNGDNAVDGDDVIALLTNWDNGDIGADFNVDGSVDGDDVIAFFLQWDQGC